MNETIKKECINLQSSNSLSFPWKIRGHQHRVVLRCLLYYMFMGDARKSMKVEERRSRSRGTVEVRFTHARWSYANGNRVVELEKKWSPKDRFPSYKIPSLDLWGPIGPRALHNCRNSVLCRCKLTFPFQITFAFAKPTEMVKKIQQPNKTKIFKTLRLQLCILLPYLNFNYSNCSFI